MCRSFCWQSENYYSQFSFQFNACKRVGHVPKGTVCATGLLCGTYGLCFGVLVCVLWCLCALYAWRARRVANTNTKYTAAHANPKIICCARLDSIN